MRQIRFVGLIALVLLFGCTTETDDQSTPFTEVADVQQLMLTVVEPSAEVYWDAVGWIMDLEEGTTEIRPGSDEEWEQVRNAAFVLAESGNLLMMEGRAVDDEAWVAMSQSLTEVAQRAIEAAEARNEAEVFDAGAEIYYTCLNCHSEYARETLRPNFSPEAQE